VTGLPKGQIIEQAYVILLKLEKNKEVLVRNDWGELQRKLEETLLVVGLS